MRLRYLTLGAFGLAAALATPALAGANLITNGSFEYSSGTTYQSPCQVGYNCSGSGNNIEGWTMDPSSTYPQPGAPPQPNTNSWLPGYTFVMDTTTAVTGNAGALTLWNSPGPQDGLNFLAQDSVYHPDAIQQTVNLVQGQSYDLNFWWATAQQTNFFGDTYDFWQVSLGGSVLTSTSETFNPDEQHTDWENFDYNFVWTGATGPTVISFLDICTHPEIGLRPRSGHQQRPPLLASGQRVVDHRRAGVVDLGDDDRRFRRPRLCGLPRPPRAGLDRLNPSVRSNG